MKTMRRCRRVEAARSSPAADKVRGCPGQARRAFGHSTIWLLCLSRRRISCLSVVDYVEKRAEWKSARGLCLMIRPGRGRADI